MGKLPNKLALEGHTYSKQYPEGSTYGNWELSTDCANAARRPMFQNGVRPDQMTQVRGFVGQRLRKADAPLDPANRRISLIVQYQEKKPGADATESSGAVADAESKGRKVATESKSEANAQPAAIPHKDSVFGFRFSVFGFWFSIFLVRSYS